MPRAFPVTFFMQRSAVAPKPSNAVAVEAMSLSNPFHVPDWLGGPNFTACTGTVGIVKKHKLNTHTNLGDDFGDCLMVANII